MANPKKISGNSLAPNAMRQLRSWAGWLALLTACSGSGSDTHDPSAGRLGARDAAAVDGASLDVRGPADLCPLGLLDGSYTIETKKDVAAIADCTEISGGLSIAGNVTVVNLPTLKGIGGSLKIADTNLTSFSLPGLERVGGDLTISSNAALTTFNLQGLHTIGSALVIDSNDALTEFNLEALAMARFLGVTNDAALGVLSLPSLETVSVFVIRDNAVLTTISLANLVSITGDGFIVNSNLALTTFSLPALTTLIGDIAIMNNPMLPVCQIDAIVARLNDSSIPVQATGNDSSATCP